MENDSSRQEKGPIGVFDSGFGGLTVLKEIRKLLPQYDYIFLGDNARAPYGTRSFEMVYSYTLEGVKALFKEGCQLVILACNTASAKALRSIQMHDMPALGAEKRVLGVIRPTAEIVGTMSKTRHMGLLATEGTVNSHSYDLEISKFSPDLTINSVACPMWVPLVENQEYNTPGADYHVKQKIDELMKLDNKIDLILLGCTHYPFLLPKIKQYMPENVNVICQGEYVSASLKDYLHRHPEMEKRISGKGKCRYLTTDDTAHFDQASRIFLGEEIHSEHYKLD